MKALFRPILTRHRLWPDGTTKQVHAIEESDIGPRPNYLGPGLGSRGIFAGHVGGRVNIYTMPATDKHPDGQTCWSFAG